MRSPGSRIYPATRKTLGISISSSPVACRFPYITSASRLEIFEYTIPMNSNVMSNRHKVACFLPYQNFAAVFRQRRSRRPPANTRTRRYVTATAHLPSWERPYEREIGLVGTSYESATIEDVASLGNDTLRILVDLSVTCASENYLSPGQFLFIKPWGDEDGSIEACTFTSPPGNGSTLEFFVRESGAVGEAALAGEMLEVSDVMGDGFSPCFTREAFSEADSIVVVCDGLFCIPPLLALSDEARPVAVFVTGKKNGEFERRIEDWIEGGDRRVFYCENSFVLGGTLLDYFEDKKNVAILMSANKEACDIANDIVRDMRIDRQITILTP